MVTPLDAPHEHLPVGVRTRISLRLSNTTTEMYQRLLDAIHEIPETSILFLRQLAQIKATMTRSDGQVEIITIDYDNNDQVPNSRGLTRWRDSNGITTCDTSAYLCFNHTIRGMPPDRRRQGRNEAKIVLAFPFDPSTEKPILSPRGQHMFAYLPLQRIPQIMVSIRKPKMKGG